MTNHSIKKGGIYNPFTGTDFNIRKKIYKRFHPFQKTSPYVTGDDGRIIRTAALDEYEKQQGFYHPSPLSETPLKSGGKSKRNKKTHKRKTSKKRHYAR